MGRGSLTGDGFKISLIIYNKINIDAKHYINLWISSISFLVIPIEPFAHDSVL